MSTIRKALAYAFLSAYSVTLIQFAATLAIVRLLTPEEIGIYSVAAVFIGIASLLRDFGASNYLIHTDDINQQILRTAFGIILVIAVCVGMLLLASSQAIAGFYSTPTLETVVDILALNFFLAPLGSVTLTMARRSMRFRALGAINVSSAVASASTSISLAYLGFGPHSLAWAGVVGTITTFLLSLFLRTPEIPWIPSLRQARKILGFGMANTTANLLGYLNTSASDLIIGRFLTMGDVGIFNRATSVTQFVRTSLTRAMNPVLLPWLADLRRSHSKHVYGFQKTTELYTGIVWPALTTIALLSDQFVYILFGHQWSQSASLVPYICIASIISSPYIAASSLYVAVGKPSADLITQAINLPVKIGAIVFAVPYGVSAIAIVWSVSSIVAAVTHHTLLYRYVSITTRQIFNSLYKSGIITASVGASLAVSNTWILGDLSSALHLVLGSTIAFLAWGLSAGICEHQLWGEFKKLISRTVD